MAEYKPSKPGIVFGLATAVLAGYMGLVGCTRSDLPAPTNTPTPTVYNSPTPTKTPTPTPTATLEDIATATPTPTPTPEAVGGPLHVVVNYGDMIQFGFVEDEDGTYIPHEDYEKLNIPQNSNAWFQFINPLNGLELTVDEDYKDCRITLDARPLGYAAFNCPYTGEQELRIIASFEDNEYVLRIPVNVYKLSESTPDSNGNGNGNGGPPPTNPPPTPDI